MEGRDFSDTETDFSDSDNSDIYGDLTPAKKNTSSTDDADIFLELEAYEASLNAAKVGGVVQHPKGNPKEADPPNDEKENPDKSEIANAQQKSDSVSKENTQVSNSLRTGDKSIGDEKKVKKGSHDSKSRTKKAAKIVKNDSKISEEVHENDSEKKGKGNVSNIADERNTRRHKSKEKKKSKTSKRDPVSKKEKEKNEEAVPKEDKQQVKIDCVDEKNISDGENAKVSEAAGRKSLKNAISSTPKPETSDSKHSRSSQRNKKPDNSIIQNSQGRHEIADKSNDISSSKNCKVQCEKKDTKQITPVNSEMGFVLSRLSRSSKQLNHKSSISEIKGLECSTKNPVDNIQNTICSLSEGSKKHVIEGTVKDTQNQAEKGKCDVQMPVLDMGSHPKKNNFQEVALAQSDKQKQEGTNNLEVFQNINKLLGSTMQSFVDNISSGSAVIADLLNNQNTHGNDSDKHEELHLPGEAKEQHIMSESKPPKARKSNLKQSVGESALEPPPLRRSPRKAKGVSSQMDLFDDFLISRNKEKKTKEVSALQAEMKDLQAKLLEADKRCKELDEDNKTLLVNISSLWKTAMAQIREKSNEISQLKREKESIIFRRAMRQIPRDEFDRVVSRISAYDNAEFSSFLEDLQKGKEECSCGGIRKGSATPNLSFQKIKSNVKGERVTNISDNHDAHFIKTSLGKQGEKITISAEKRRPEKTLRRGQNKTLAGVKYKRQISHKDDSHRSGFEQYTCRKSLNEKFTRSLERDRDLKGRLCKRTNGDRTSMSPSGKDMMKKKNIHSRFGRQRCESDNREYNRESRHEHNERRHYDRQNRNEFDSPNRHYRVSEIQDIHSRSRRRDSSEEHFEQNSRPRFGHNGCSNVKDDQRNDVTKINHLYEHSELTDVPRRSRKALRESDRIVNNGNININNDADKHMNDKDENYSDGQNKSSSKDNITREINISRSRELESTAAEQAMLSNSLYGRRMLAKLNARNKIDSQKSNAVRETPPESISDNTSKNTCEEVEKYVCARKDALKNSANLKEVEKPSKELSGHKIRNTDPVEKLLSIKVMRSEDKENERKGKTSGDVQSENAYLVEAEILTTDEGPETEEQECAHNANPEINNMKSVKVSKKSGKQTVYHFREALDSDIKPVDRESNSESDLNGKISDLASSSHNTKSKEKLKHSEGEESLLSSEKIDNLRNYRLSDQPTNYEASERNSKGDNSVSKASCRNKECPDLKITLASSTNNEFTDTRCMDRENSPANDEEPSENQHLSENTVDCVDTSPLVEKSQVQGNESERVPTESQQIDENMIQKGSNGIRKLGNKGENDNELASELNDQRYDCNIVPGNQTPRSNSVLKPDREEKDSSRLREAVNDISKTKISSNPVEDTPEFEIVYEDIVKNNLSSNNAKKSSRKDQRQLATRRKAESPIPEKSSREICVSQISEEEKCLSPSYMKSIMETVQFLTYDDSSCDSQMIDIENLSDEDESEGAVSANCKANIQNCNEESDVRTFLGKETQRTSQLKDDQQVAVEQGNNADFMEGESLHTLSAERPQTANVDIQGESDTHQDRMHMTSDKEGKMEDEVVKTNKKISASEKVGEADDSRGACIREDYHSGHFNSNENADPSSDTEGEQDQEERNEADDKLEEKDSSKSTDDKHGYLEEHLFPEEEEHLYEDGFGENDKSDKCSTGQETGSATFEQELGTNGDTPKTVEKEYVNKMANTVNDGDSVSQLEMYNNVNEVTTSTNKKSEERIENKHSSKGIKNSLSWRCEETHVGRNCEGSNSGMQMLAKSPQESKPFKIPRLKKVSESSTDGTQQGGKESHSPLICEENLMRERNAKSKKHLQRRGISPPRTRRSPLKNSKNHSPSTRSYHPERVSPPRSSRRYEKPKPQRKSCRREQLSLKRRSRHSGRLSPQRKIRPSPERISPRRTRSEVRGKSERDDWHIRDRRKRSGSPKGRDQSVTFKRKRRENDRVDRPEKRRRMEVKDTRLLFSSDEELEDVNRGKRDNTSGRRLSQRLKDKDIDKRDRKRHVDSKNDRTVERKDARIKEVAEQRTEDKSRKPTKEVKHNLLVNKSEKTAGQVIPVDRKLLLSRLNECQEDCFSDSEKEEGELDDEDDEVNFSIKVPENMKVHHPEKPSRDSSHKEISKTDQEKMVELNYRDSKTSKENYRSSRGLDISKISKEKSFVCKTLEKEESQKLVLKFNDSKLHAEVKESTISNVPELQTNVPSMGKTVSKTSEFKNLIEDATFCPQDLYQAKTLPLVSCHNHSSSSRASGSDDTIDMIVKRHNNHFADGTVTSSDDSEMSLLQFIDDQPEESTKTKEVCQGTKERNRARMEETINTVDIPKENEENIIDAETDGESCTGYHEVDVKRNSHTGSGFTKDISNDALSESSNTTSDIVKSSADTESDADNCASLLAFDLQLSHSQTSPVPESFEDEQMESGVTCLQFKSQEMREMRNEAFDNETESNAIVSQVKDSDVKEVLATHIESNINNIDTENTSGEGNANLNDAGKCDNEDRIEENVIDTISEGGNQEDILYPSNDMHSTEHDKETRTKLVEVSNMLEGDIPVSSPCSLGTKDEDSCSSDTDSSCSGCSKCGNDDSDTSSSDSSDSSTDSDSDDDENGHETNNPETRQSWEGLANELPAQHFRKTPKKTPAKSSESSEEMPCKTRKTPHKSGATPGKSGRSAHKTPRKTPHKTPCKRVNKTPNKSPKSRSSVLATNSEEEENKCVAVNSLSDDGNKEILLSSNELEDKDYSEKSGTADQEIKRNLTFSVVNSPEGQLVVVKPLEPNCESMSSDDPKSVSGNKVSPSQVSFSSFALKASAVPHRVRKPNFGISNHDSPVISILHKNERKAKQSATEVSITPQKRKIYPTVAIEKQSPDGKKCRILSPEMFPKVKGIELGMDSPSKGDVNTERPSDNTSDDKVVVVDIKRKKVRRQLNLGFSTADSSRVFVTSMQSTSSKPKLSAESHKQVVETNSQSSSNYTVSIRRSPRKK